MWCQKRCGRQPDDGLVKDAGEVLNGAELVVAKFSKCGGRSGMKKGVGKGTGGDYSGIDGGYLRYRTGRKKKLHGHGDALGTVGRDVHPVSPVVLHGAVQVPTINAVGSPCALLVWCFVHQDLCARRGKGSSIKVEATI